jgi:4-aminobutyrate aminotransferase-like enzyme
MTQSVAIPFPRGSVGTSYGLVLLGCGERTIRFRLALNIKKEQIDEGVGIIRRALKEMSSGK